MVELNIEATAFISTAPHKPSAPKKRYDRAAAEERLRQAMANMLAEVPVDKITWNSVAAEAGVSTGLIRAYFGHGDGLNALDNLRHAALVMMSDEVAELAVEHIFARQDEGPEAMLRGGISIIFTPDDHRVRRYFRVVTRLAYFNLLPDWIEENFPVARILPMLAPAFGLSEAQGRRWAAVSTAMVMGWLLLNKPLMDTTQLELPEGAEEEMLLRAVMAIAHCRAAAGESNG